MRSEAVIYQIQAFQISGQDSKFRWVLFQKCLELVVRVMHPVMLFEALVYVCFLFYEVMLLRAVFFSLGC